MKNVVVFILEGSNKMIKRNASLPNMFHEKLPKNQLLNSLGIQKAKKQMMKRLGLNLPLPLKNISQIEK